MSSSESGDGVHLAGYDPGGLDRGAGWVKECLWVVASWLLFRLCPLKLSGLKCAVLRLFGAKVGRGVVIKPRVTITFPWKLKVGDDVWLGEESWILNLAEVEIGSDACISQRAFLCSGNHDYTKPGFDLMIAPIWIGRGAWVGAGGWIGPGVRVGEHAVLTACSVASKDLDAFGIYRGNPAERVKTREIRPGGGK